VISDDEVERLVDAASRARDRAYAPYSGFRVGAAVLAGGNVYIGANIENASYPLSVCAERNAVAAAVIAGNRDIVAVAVATDADEPTPPCGGCRQVLNEFGPKMRVISEGVKGKRGDWSLPELLPNAFGPEDLGVASG
jgi:cytidine deaminase